MLRPRDDHDGKRFGANCCVRGYENEGRMALIKRGDVTTRVGPLNALGVVSGTSFCVPTRDVSDVRPDVRNLRRRFMSHHAGKRFSQSVLVRGLEDRGRHFIVQEGAIETRIIAISQNGSSEGDSFVVPSEYIYDPRDAGPPGIERTTMSARGETILPATHRAAHGVTGRWVVEIESTENGWLIRPIGPAND